MDIVNVCTAGLMLSSAALFAGNAVYDYKFGKKTTVVIRQFESGKPSSVIDDVLNQTLLLTPPTIEIVGFPGGGGKAYHHAAYKAASYAVSHHPLRV